MKHLMRGGEKKREKRVALRIGPDLTQMGPEAILKILENHDI